MTPDHHRRFFVHEGPILEEVDDLRRCLPEMSDAQFRYHVSEGKNDFSRWLSGIDGMEMIARSVRDARTREELIGILDGAGRFAQGKSPHGQMSDERFASLRDQYSARNEELQDRFERMAREIEESLQDKMPEEIEDASEELEERYRSVRERMSDMRKQGKDVLLPTLMLKQFPSKLALARNTRERRDFELVKSLLAQAESELEEIHEKRDIDIKKDVYRLAGIEDEQ